ncbi:MAG: sodium/solute symporter [Opitutaceae bacterium]|jgi:SSS family solute:Na+ symporter|nr:sodium/solute symporter [Opitutaceae bacterium]
MIAIGLFTGRRNKSTEQYFLAGKAFSGWVIGISFIGSIISSVTFLAIPADAFKTAWLRFIPNLAFPVITILAAFIFIPFYRRGTITSAYGYLAARFGSSISYYAAVIFLVSQLSKTSTIAYLLSILLESITGWDFVICLLVVTGVTIIYTVKGGVVAVIWTDVIQTFILLAAAFVCIGYVVHSLPGGFATLVSEASSWHKFAFNYDVQVAADSAAREAIQAGLPADMPAAAVRDAALPLHGRLLAPVPWGFMLGEKTVLMMLLLGFFQFLGVITDQSTVQRWCAAKTAREARRSMFVLGFGCLPVWALFQFLGTSLFVYYIFNADRLACEALLGLRKAEHILPHFITNSLPAGFVGVVIAGALAAAMSTLSASINTSSMVFVDDIYKKFGGRGGGDPFYLRLGRISSFVAALVMIAGALFIRMLDAPTLTDLSQQIAAIIAGGVPGVFLAGMLTRRVNMTGAWAGLLASLLFVLWIKAGDAGWLPDALRVRLLPHYLAIAGNVIAIAIAWPVSMLAPRGARDLANLTLWDQGKSPLQ